MSDYMSFLAGKAPRAQASGIEPSSLPAHLFDFQAACVDFALRQGRAGIYLDTGLGKTLVQLEWCKQAAAATNGRALILTPLAVARQIEREGRRFSYDCRVIREQGEAGDGINICNYDRLDKIDTDDFGAVSLDESGVLKNFSGKTTRALISAFGSHRFRLSATATPAPNDHMELGNQSEFLGIMAGNEMLSRFFINDTSQASQRWRIKGHAEQAFWDWMASWSRMAQSPEDLGFDGAKFKLPPLNIVKHKAIGSDVRGLAGTLFEVDVSATAVFDVKRQTSAARAKLAAEIVWESLPWKKANAGACEEMPSTPNGVPTIGAQARATTPPSSDPARKRKSIRQNGGMNISDTASALSCKTIEQCSIDKMERAPYADPEHRAAMASSMLTIATPQEPSEESSAIAAMSASGTSPTTPKTFGEPHSTLNAPTLPSWVLWCDTNDEQTALENEFGDAAISIRGSQSPEEKEKLHDAWLAGTRPVLITKSSIFGFGVNWQHCHDVVFVGRSFSYEAWYQAVRRCWRFGQRKPVTVHIIVAEGEDQIGRVIDRKADDHGRMKTAMAAAMKRAAWRVEQTKIPYEPKHEGRLPTWLSAA